MTIVSSSAVTVFSNFVFLLVVLGIPVYGFFKRVQVFEVFVDGAKDGFNIAVKLIPFLVGFSVAVGMLKESHIFSLDAGDVSIMKILAPVFHFFHMPIDVAPVAIVRPFSFAASVPFLKDVLNDPNQSLMVKKMAGTVMGSSETTFYIIGVYFGSIGIKKMRHSIAVGLIADLSGVFASVAVCRWLLA